MENLSKKTEKSKINIFEALRINQDIVASSLNCHNIGRILEFDPSNQTCTVELMQVIQFRNQSINPVPLTQVPLIIYGAGNGHITLPDPTGSICLLLFLDRNIDNFKLTGEQYTPDTSRMHDFTDCVALTTFKTMANPLKDFDTRAVSIFNQELINEIAYDSFIKVYGNQVLINSIQQGENTQMSNLSLTPDAFSLNTQNTELNTQNLTINTEYQNTTAQNKISLKSAQGALVNINSLINIQNNAQNLALLIQAFLSACENITTIEGGGLTQTSKSAFSSLKSQFEELLI